MSDFGEEIGSTLKNWAEMYLRNKYHNIISEINKKSSPEQIEQFKEALKQKDAQFDALAKKIEELGIPGEEIPTDKDKISNLTFETEQEAKEFASALSNSGVKAEYNKVILDETGNESHMVSFNDDLLAEKIGHNSVDEFIVRSSLDKDADLFYSEEPVPEQEFVIFDKAEPISPNDNYTENHAENIQSHDGADPNNRSRAVERWKDNIHNQVEQAYKCSINEQSLSMNCGKLGLTTAHAKDGELIFFIAEKPWEKVRADTLDSRFTRDALEQRFEGMKNKNPELFEKTYKSIQEQTLTSKELPKISKEASKEFKEFDLGSEAKDMMAAKNQIVAEKGLEEISKSPLSR